MKENLIGQFISAPLGGDTDKKSYHNSISIKMPIGFLNGISLLSSASLFVSSSREMILLVCIASGARNIAHGETKVNHCDENNNPRSNSLRLLHVKRDYYIFIYYLYNTKKNKSVKMYSKSTKN